MKVLKGITSNIRNSISVEGTNSNVSTLQVSTFKIENQVVKLSSADPIIIEDGDDVILAGKIKKQIFNAYAYKNLSSGIDGNSPYLSLVFTGAVVLIFSLPLLISLMSAGASKAIAASIFLIPFSILGWITLNRGLRVIKAKKIIEKL